VLLEEVNNIILSKIESV